MTTKDFEKKQILFVFTDQGEKLSFKNDNIVITRSDGSIKHQSTCYLLFAVFISGHITITSGLLQRSQRFGFSIILMTYTMRSYCVFSAKAEGNTLLRKKQYCYEKFDIGAYITSNKIHNQAELLKKQRHKNENRKQVIESLNQYKQNVLKENLTLAEIMGLEGVAAKIYFSQLFEKHNWTARRPRVKHDIVNTLQDIGYTLLFNIIDALLEMYGFDTYNGVLHRQFFHRKSLVCDLVEPFRVIIDECILKMLNLGQYCEEDFLLSQKQYFLVGKKASPYIILMIQSILEYKNEIFLYIQQYYRAFMREKDIQDYPFFVIGEKKNAHNKL